MRADPAEIRKKVDRKLLGGGLAFFSSITRKEVAKSEFEYKNYEIANFKEAVTQKQVMAMPHYLR